MEQSRLTVLAVWMAGASRSGALPHRSCCLLLGWLLPGFNCVEAEHRVTPPAASWASLFHTTWNSSGGQNSRSGQKMTKCRLSKVHLLALECTHSQTDTECCYILGVTIKAMANYGKLLPVNHDLVVN